MHVTSGEVLHKSAPKKRFSGNEALAVPSDWIGPGNQPMINRVDKDVFTTPTRVLKNYLFRISCPCL